MNTDKPTGTLYPGKGLSIKQLLHALRMELVQTTLHRPPDMSTQDVLEREEEATIVVSDTRCLLNTFNTVVQLPSDILVMIPSFLHADRDLFTASQVCRRWRAIVVSSPLLWRRIDCRHLNRTIIALERSQSVPLRLKLDRDFSADAMDMVLDHGSKITSVSINLSLDRIQSLHPRLVTPSVEELVLFPGSWDWGEIGETVNIQGEFLSMRKLSISGFVVPTDRITAPNLTDLSLEIIQVDFRRDITAQSILNMLRGCLQLETLLINILPDRPYILQSHNPVTFPKLHSIELGNTEVWAGLIFHLHFPVGAAVGFRDIEAVGGTWPCESIRHVLATIDVESVTLAHILHRETKAYGLCLFRFEGPKGSIEINVLEDNDRDTFGPNGLLLSYPFRLENVKTLHVMDFHIGDDTLKIIVSAMHNLVSIKFTGNTVYPRSLIVGGSPLLFPHLKHIAGLPPEGDVVKMVRARKRNGMPLNSLDLHGDLKYKFTAKCLRELRTVVKDVKVWRCADLPERWTSNALLNVWEGAGYRGPDTLDWVPVNDQGRYEKY